MELRNSSRSGDKSLSSCHSQGPRVGSVRSTWCLDIISHAASFLAIGTQILWSIISEKSPLPRTPPPPDCSSHCQVFFSCRMAFTCRNNVKYGLPSCLFNGHWSSNVFVLFTTSTLVLTLRKQFPLQNMTSPQFCPFPTAPACQASSCLPHATHLLLCLDNPKWEN